MGMNPSWQQNFSDYATNTMNKNAGVTTGGASAKGAAMDPLTIAALVLPSLISGVGSFFDDTPEQQLKLSKEQLGLNREELAERKRQFDTTMPWQKLEGIGSASGVLANLLSQKSVYQDKKSKGQGFLS